MKALRYQDNHKEMILILIINFINRDKYVEIVLLNKLVILLQMINYLENLEVRIQIPISIRMFKIRMIFQNTDKLIMYQAQFMEI